MLEVPKHPFYPIALLVQRFVVVAEDCPVRSRWDHHQGPSLLNPFDQLIRIIACVGKHGVGAEPFQQRPGLCTVMPFASRHDEPERIAQRIAHGMQFRGKPASATP